MIPESPRWLLCKGRTTEVATIIRKVCEINKRVCPPNIEKLLKPPPSSSGQTDHRCISLFGNSYLRLISICFPCIWFTINLVYYGLILNMNSFEGNVYLNSVSCFFFFISLVRISSNKIQAKTFFLNGFNASRHFCRNSFSENALTFICIKLLVLVAVFSSYNNDNTSQNNIFSLVEYRLTCTDVKWLFANNDTNRRIVYCAFVSVRK